MLGAREPWECVWARAAWQFRVSLSANCCDYKACKKVRVPLLFSDHSFSAYALVSTGQPSGFPLLALTFPESWVPC